MARDTLLCLPYALGSSVSGSIFIEMLFGSLLIYGWYGYHSAVLLYAISPGNKYIIGHSANE